MEKNKRIAAIIQARINSKRLRGKILKKINNTRIIEILILRLKKSKKINDIIVACSNNKDDEKIIKICKKLKIKYFVGSEHNVLERYYNAAKKFKIQNIVRITSDCPLIDPFILDNLIEKYFSKKCDYASNTIDPTFPDGFDMEIFKFDLLKERYFKSVELTEKEHVTPGMLNNKKYKYFSLKLDKDFSMLRLTLDDKNDFKIIKKLFYNFKNNLYIKLDQILNLYDQNPKFFGLNSYKIRNENITINKGQKYWIKAKKIIPGGTMLYSKNPDLLLPKKWPAYFSKAKGCEIWDLENNKFIDLYSMGIGTNLLGYCQKDIDKAVINTIQNGNMSSLNSIDEIELAEKLIELHPWAEMARFTRSGGEANAVAIRIARAASKKDKIAICGYHGWHDWYLSSNLTNTKNLDTHLMKNVPTDGIPKGLKNTTFSFKYNNFQELKSLVDKNNIGIIKMEVKRFEDPKNDFLKKVRNLATRKNIVLIFDECTSGFRESLGGIHKKFKVEPDIAIFGKALGNGYAINSIIGKRSIMDACNRTFISSTFWTERIGYTAANKTLEIMKKQQSWKILINKGRKIKKMWKKIAKSNSLDLNITGMDAIPIFSFKNIHNDNLLYKTFITQEMLKKNILASNVIYLSTAHTDHYINRYFDYLDKIFSKIRKCEDDKLNINSLLNYPVSLSGMRNK